MTTPLEQSAKAAYEQAHANLGVSVEGLWESASEKQREHYRAVARACVGAWQEAEKEAGRG